MSPEDKNQKPAYSLPLPPSAKPRVSLLDVLLAPAGCLLRSSPVYLIIPVAVLAAVFVYLYLTANSNFFGLIGLHFDRLTISPNYAEFKTSEYVWKITYEKPNDSTFAGLIRHVSHNHDAQMLIATHDILVTTGDFSDPTLVKTSVFNHHFSWQTDSLQNPAGAIHLLHAVPANEKIYNQLLQISTGQQVAIVGQEILQVDVYDPQGNHLGYIRDEGCNALLVKSVDFVSR